MNVLIDRYTYVHTYIHTYIYIHPIQNILKAFANSALFRLARSENSGDDKCNGLVKRDWILRMMIHGVVIMSVSYFEREMEWKRLRTLLLTGLEE
jgi:hypothetical protein